jgi:hypothetical protein
MDVDPDSPYPVQPRSRFGWETLASYTKKLAVLVRHNFYQLPSDPGLV